MDEKLEDEIQEIIQEYFQGDVLDLISEVCGEPFNIEVDYDGRVVVVSGPTGEKLIDLDYMIHLHRFGELGIH